MSRPLPNIVPIVDAARRDHVLGKVGWGRGPSQIGLPPEDESEAETTLRIATDPDGSLLLLDAVNGRVARMDPDGRVATDRKLPLENSRDFAIAPNRGLAVLRDTQIVLLGADGKTRAALPVPSDVRGRSVVIDKNDVYVESNRGTFMRVGDVSGALDPNPKPVPGRPTRDGTGYVKALIADTERGTVHVFLIDREASSQRFSRLLSLSIVVDGIFLVDTDRSGTIYLGVTGNAANGAAPVAQLVCLEPQHGESMGAIDLPLRVGPEAILDAKALDEGGVVYSVATKDGVRVERHDCNSP